MRIGPRRTIGLLLGLLLALSAGEQSFGEETRRCPRCEHRFVQRPLDASMEGKPDPHCRVCRVQLARMQFLDYKYRHAPDEQSRKRVVEEWDAFRRALRRDNYAVGEILSREGPRLLPLDTTQVLSLAQHDEAMRCQRRASWCKQMAKMLKRGRATWRRVHYKDAAWARWAFDDLTQAWKERAALYEEMAKRYRSLARDPTTDALNGPLPKPSTPAKPEGEAGDAGATRVVEELRSALRQLLVLEHESLERLIALTRGGKSARVPDASYFERMRALSGDAFSTAIVANFNRTRIRQVDLLRSNLLMDGSLDHFFERAPVMAEGLRKHANSKQAGSRK